MKHLFLWTLFILLFGGLLSSSCAKRIQPSWVSKIATVREPIGAEEIFRLPDGDQISLPQLLSDLEPSSVIFAGETHDQIEHHRNQLKILRGLMEKNTDVLVGMEMFERSQQPLLD